MYNCLFIYLYLYECTYIHLYACTNINIYRLVNEYKLLACTVFKSLCVLKYCNCNALACPFQCKEENKCISGEKVCDGDIDCYYLKQDEKNCGKYCTEVYFEWA